MILVSLIHGVCTVKHHIQPFWFIVRHNVSVVFCKLCDIPGTVRFQICLIDHIDSVLIAEFIDQRCIRIMTGADRVDIVLFHNLEVFAKLFFGDMTSAHRTEFMTVHTLEYDTFAVQCHNSVFHLETTESNLLRNHFLKFTGLVIYLHFQIIELRIFCTPEHRIFYFPCVDFFAIQCFFIFNYSLSIFGKCNFHFTFTPCICSDLKCCCT